MKKILLAILKKTPLHDPLKNWAERRLQEKKLKEWERNGRPVPPPAFVKHRMLKSIASKSGLKVLVETGTFRGDMVEATKRDFDKIYSIELSKELYDAAKERFKDEANIELIHGDSGVELGNLINRIEQPALFWLDGHYSGGVTAKGDKVTPVYEELTQIFNVWDGGHVIIIDDARLFETDTSYPSMEELIAFIKFRKPGANIVIENDGIMITS